MQVSFESICTSMRRQIKDREVQALAGVLDNQQWGTLGWAHAAADLSQNIATRMRTLALKRAHLRHGLGRVVLSAFSDVVNIHKQYLWHFTSL